jgi:glycosyltransferase involved in cell wall biosynthesis
VRGNTTSGLGDLRIAIVHYWFLGHGGGERVVEVLAEMFPGAHLYCLVADPATMTRRLREHPLTTSFIQWIPGSRRWYRHLLLLHPLALEQLDLSDYDLILSSESGPAKGVISHTDTCHICYCHSPMRYLWDLYPRYRQRLRGVIKTSFSLTAHYLRLWDLASADRVDYFVANSRNVARRIRKHYRRDAHVVYPPVNVSAGRIADKIDDYYLLVGRLIDYKRVDLAIQACNQLQRSLRIIGDGEQYDRLRALAGPTITFLRGVEDDTVRENYAHCRALLFPGEEDFGMVSVEAQSFGRPVIAYGRGGALETVIGVTRPKDAARSTGIFFSDQTAHSLSDAILYFESLEGEFSPEFIQSSVQRFDIPRFKSEMYSFINESLACHRSNIAPGYPIGGQILNEEPTIDRLQSAEK